MLDFATNAARSVLGIVGVAEQRTEGLVGDVGELREAVAAMHRTAEAVERHVEALGEVTEALPALTDVRHAAVRSTLGAARPRCAGRGGRARALRPATHLSPPAPPAGGSTRAHAATVSARGRIWKRASVTSPR